jgi:hypothetical protein
MQSWCTIINRHIVVAITHHQSRLTFPQIAFTCARQLVGHDDALAIMLAASHPSLQLLGVSTVACNQAVEKTTTNALAVLHAIGREDVPVFQGQHKPLMRETRHCDIIHGDTGLLRRAFTLNPNVCIAKEMCYVLSCFGSACLCAAHRMPKQCVVGGSGGLGLSHEQSIIKT